MDGLLQSKQTSPGKQSVISFCHKYTLCKIDVAPPEKQWQALIRSR